jgi:hypothetical protein
MRVKRGYVAALAALCAAAIVYAGPRGGIINGKAIYEGTPVKPTPIDMSKEPSCAQQHTTPVLTESVVTGPNNALENVTVYVSAGTPDEATPPSQPAKFDQKGCQTSPTCWLFGSTNLWKSPTTIRLLTTSIRCPSSIASGTNRSRRDLPRFPRNTTNRSSFW